MSGLPPYIRHRLKQREADGALRRLSLLKPGIDFYSNDYLGYSRNPAVGKLASSILEEYHSHTVSGSTGSRLISGNSSLAEDTENFLAQYYHSGSALIFNSGYDANLGLVASVASRSDVVFYDEYVHASIRDGLRLSFAAAHSFRHNDTGDLLKKINQVKATGSVFVMTESVFSMDGDMAPLEEMVRLCRQYGLYLIVDEAHAAGYLGEKGKGLTLPYAGDIFARVITFGKAWGVHGAVVLGSDELRAYLVNFARSFIYTTALPPQAYAEIFAVHRLAENHEQIRSDLHEIIAYFNRVKSRQEYPVLPSATAIQSVIVPGNDQVKKLAENLQAEGLNVWPVLYPTVPGGKERLRVILHAYNTKNEIDLLIKSLANA